MENRLQAIHDIVLPSDTINRQLEELYRRLWHSYEKICAVHTNRQLSNIYLLTVPEEFIKAKIKILILGKETQGWGGEFKDTPSITELRQLYKLYVHEEKGNQAAFMRFVQWILTIKEGIEVLPNNIIKIGKKSRSGHYKSVAREQMNILPVVQEEIRIINPDVIICPTSNILAYNEYLTAMFGSYTEEVLQEDLRVSVRQYDTIKEIPVIICPHPQGKSTEQLDAIKNSIAMYIKMKYDKKN